ncbi:MAG TPA: bifunctional riboflavin kinase/FMN adenylyltransferase, partial [Hyphomicrobiales bacterium]|nr:bifunctional riboflavin kinase/FMN adenylyltransferase [Hyphomicrobiales bacterium]
MEVVQGWHSVPPQLRGASLAIGNFDGVHRGHRAVLGAARDAAEGKRPWGAMVFEPYPRKYFQPHKPFFRLTSLPRKLELLSAVGCDFTAIISFDREVAELSAADFVRLILVEAFAIKYASVGFNFFFG